MDHSCSTKYAYITCCLIIVINIIYFIITLIKLFIQHQRRRLSKYNQKMTDKQNETTSRITTTTIKTGVERLAQLYPHINEDTQLPSKWNSKEKSPTLVLQQNNLMVTYKGPGKSHKDAASVRSDYPIPSLTGIYYYEVKILSKGRDG
jgi:sensor domain CHASE-containing protein